MRKVFSSTGLRWTGVTVLLAAYVLVSQEIVVGGGLIYNAMNCLGSTMMIASSLLMRPKDWAVVIFNTVWVVIGLLTITKII